VGKEEKSNSYCIECIHDASLRKSLVNNKRRKPDEWVQNHPIATKECSTIIYFQVYIKTLLENGR